MFITFAQNNNSAIGNKRAQYIVGFLLIRDEFSEKLLRKNSTGPELYAKLHSIGEIGNDLMEYCPINPSPFNIHGCSTPPEN